jgi:hypothetical protein
MNDMRTTVPIGFFILGVLALTGCDRPIDAESGPIKVELRQEDGVYRVYRGGEPFFIRGAGLERQPPGAGSIELLAEHGANALRTWRTDEAGTTGQDILDEAHANGLAVMMGLEIARERPGQGVGVFGFDYNDSVAVAAQLEQVRAEVMKYKDHPALLVWGIGNELNLRATNPRVWNAVNDISRMIHEVDPNHLTTTSLAGISKELVDQIKERAPDLDLLSIQMYGDLPNLPRYIDETGWDGAYMVTEWGATGHWEVALTPWNAPVENTSSVKADSYYDRYNVAIGSDTTQCVGSFVFLWGQKQERTPTWYGIFLSTGEETETVDVMHYIWNDTWPDNRSPRLESVTLDDKTAYEGVSLIAGRAYPAKAVVTDPDGDALTYSWVLMHESTDLGDGGDQESTPESIADLIERPNAASATVIAPAEPGAYRLFVYAYDGHSHAAHANIPFFVNE